MAQPGQKANAQERKFNSPTHDDADITAPNLPGTPTDLPERIRLVIAEALAVDLEEVTPAKTLEELGADSLDVMEVICELEEAFTITISEEIDIDPKSTVQYWIDLAAPLAGAKKRARKKSEVPS